MKNQKKIMLLFLCCVSPVLTVLRAFPCRTRLADRDSASAVEEEVTLSNMSHVLFFFSVVVVVLTS